MATSAEEIQKQQDEARALILAGMECATPSLTTEIPLKHKQIPFSKLEGNASSNNPQEGFKETNDKDPVVVPCWSSRGHVDVSELQHMIQEGYNQIYQPVQNSFYTRQDIQSIQNYWDPVHASLYNVHIQRPSHDAWGVNKIALCFCDDFLQRVYELPWMQVFQPVIQPILDTLQIKSDQVVRLLLASLPPNVTIPVHHDSGEWVKHTHRVHVPILVADASQVLFRCGYRDRMERIDCSPGHVFEINNQAYHAVSNCTDDHRVHLILDYVDEPKYSRIKLGPGETMLQTRRSIDRLVDQGKRKTPSFLILGAQKAGTTSLYEYIVQHPLVVPAKRRETHCFDWRWNDKLTTLKKQREWCHQFYAEPELRKHPSCLTGDSTPSYLIDSKRVIPRIKRVFNWDLKFFVMLRDPVRRAESHFAMVTSTKGTEAQLKARGNEWREKSFQDVVFEDLRAMERCGLIPYWNIEHGSFDSSAYKAFIDSKEEYLAWDKYISNIPLNSGSYSLLGRGLYALNLIPWLRSFDKKSFLFLRVESLKEEGVNAVLESVWSHLELPNFQIEDTEAKNTREYGSLLDENLQIYLHRFFEPQNRRLEALLGPEWKDSWVL